MLYHHPFTDRRSRKKEQRKLLLVLLALAVLLAAILLLGPLMKRLEPVPENAGSSGAAGASQIYDYEEPENIITYNGHSYRLKEDLSTVLILGIDDPELTETEGVRNTSQADLLILAVYDPGENKSTLIQLNRDTMVDMPTVGGLGEISGTTWGQLALAHTYGSSQEQCCENTRWTVSNLLYNVTIDSYVAVTMASIPVINDLVGGVTVTIEDNFEGVDDNLAWGSTITLHGEEAETFVRSRSGMADDKSNINRMNRQRQYMTGLVESFRSCMAADENFPLQVYEALSGDLVTDCTADELVTYAEIFSRDGLGEIVSPEGTITEGEVYIEFYPDETALKELVLDIFYE